MSFASIVALLQTALMLLGIVSANPSLPQTTRDNAIHVAQTAIAQATTALASSKQSAPQQNPVPAMKSCSLTVDGAEYQIVPCDVQDNGKYGIDISSKNSKYFLDGVNTTNDVGGYWNGATASSHAHAVLPGGKLSQVGNCYQNAEVALCISDSESSSGVSVPGMSQYTDKDFGFSFWYPNNYVVSEVPVTSPSQYQDGLVVKQLIVAMVGDTNLVHNAVSIREYTSPDSKVLVQSDCAKFACTPALYYFDKTTHTWMFSTEDPDTLQLGLSATADVSDNTMGGLHIFRSKTIPLSAHNFVTIGTWTGAGIYGQLLAKTVTATDPSVATPVSQDQQIATIKAEQQAYIATQ
jgi:hypothetical protein